MANDVRLGRKPTLTHHQRQEAIKRLNAGKETQGEIALLQCEPLDDFEVASMSESGSSANDPATEFVKELASKLPVEAAYKEILSPGAEETGQIFSDIIKTIHLALAPFQFLGPFKIV